MRLVSGLILMILKSYSLPGSSGPALFSGPVVGRCIEAPSSRRPRRSSISVLWQSASMFSPSSTNAPNVAIRETLPFTICPTLWLLNQSPQMSFTCLMPSDTRRFSGSIFSTFAVTGSPLRKTSCGFFTRPVQLTSPTCTKPSKPSSISTNAPNSAMLRTFPVTTVPTGYFSAICSHGSGSACFMKQALPDPWLQIAEKYPVGTVVTGKVRNIAEFGAFVEIEDGFDGLVHVGDVSWTGRVKNPHEVFRKGEPVTAKVLKIDPENRRVSLGIKQVNDIWGEWFKSHKVGQIVKGKVSRIANFGAFVELGENIEALCHNTEIEDRRGRRDEGASMHRPTTGPLKSAGPLEPGKEYDFKIIKISPETRRIGLSFRAAAKQIERKEIEQYKSTTKSSSTATIGDAIQSKLSAR